MLTLSEEPGTLELPATYLLLPGHALLAGTLRFWGAGLPTESLFAAAVHQQFLELRVFLPG